MMEAALLDRKKYPTAIQSKKLNGLNHFTLIQYDLNFIKTNKTL